MAVVADTLVINGTNLGTFGLQWRRRDGWGDAPSAKLVTHELPVADGVFFQEAVENTTRIINIEGTIHASTVSAFNTNVNEIKALLNGSLQVKFSDDTGRFITGYRTIFTIGDFQPGAIIPIKPYKLIIECPDPRRYDTSGQSIAENTDCPLGTARVRPTVTVNGTATNPTTVTLKDSAGATVSSFTMAAVLASGESWIIDSALSKVSHDDGIGGVTDALADFSGTFPELDPENSDFGSSLFPEFEDTTGTPDSLLITYTKAWR